MKIGVGRCHLHVGFTLVAQEEEPYAKCDAGAQPSSGTPNCCLAKARISDSVWAGSFRRRPYFHIKYVLGDSPSCWGCGRIGSFFVSLVLVAQAASCQDDNHQRYHHGADHNFDQEVDGHDGRREVTAPCTRNKRCRKRGTTCYYRGGRQTSPQGAVGQPEGDSL
jgi:hypothetical protein